MGRFSGKSGCCWTEQLESASYSPLHEVIEVETVIVGAGIVGLTSALKLLEAGRQVVVVEALEVGKQVTGRSSAKITTQHRLIYNELIENLGLERAREYAVANLAGVEAIKSWIAEHEIACELEAKTAYAYTLNRSVRAHLEQEAAAAQKFGITADVVEWAPLPFKTAGALRFPNQAQFNPVRYLDGLARAVKALGGRIYENSRVRQIENEGCWCVVTDSGKVQARNIVVATNIPIKSPVGMANRTQPRSHAAMTFRIDDPPPIKDMFISVEEPSHSLRIGRDRTGYFLLALGPRFSTGQDGDVAAIFAELEDWVRRNLPVGEGLWHWCNEDYDTADRIPYAGQPDHENASGFYIATGFNGWGISNGTAVGMMIADCIAGRPNSWLSLYDPLRPFPNDFHESGKSQSTVSRVDQIGRGEGGVLCVGDDEIAVRRDLNGTLHTLSAACTHKGCPVTWNNADHTWDCPCHGSIFAADGSVIHGPARAPLPKVDVDL